MDPSDVAHYDQELAATREALDLVVAAHRCDITSAGDDKAIMSIAVGIAVRQNDDPVFIVNLLAVALNRLAHAEKV